MVIITSNDDLIRQLAQNQWQKTLLIDLDAQPSTTTRNGNLLNWNLFAELSQLVRKKKSISLRFMYLNI